MEGGADVAEVSDTLFGFNPKEITFDAAPPYDSTQWMRIHESSRIKLDLRYASRNNFMETQVYECAKCFLRPHVGKQLIKLSFDLEKEGYGMILYDCYRPLPAQQKLWDIMPNINYVTPPSKGSMHNRGHAVDIGLFDLDTGEIIDMGTDFDYFGEEAHYAYANLPEEIVTRRFILRDRLKKRGFSGIRTEWWHFSYRGQLSELSDWEWWCE